MMASEQQDLELQEIKSTRRLVDCKKKLRRSICMCPESERNQLQDSLPRFGPLYRIDPSLEPIDKEKAWHHVLEKSPDRKATTTTIYATLMSIMEEKAREAYAEGTVDQISGTDFCWMMIKDSCLFLQMALFILGGSKQLGYPEDDKFFGKKKNPKQMKEWIKSMFFVGNQIPFVVLTEIMKQKFFQQVISQGKWKLPSELSKRVLYRLLVLPALESPIDLIHALQMQILGPQMDDSTEEEEVSDDDEIEDQTQVSINLKSLYKSCPRATDLNQKGLHFEACSIQMEVCQLRIIMRKSFQFFRYFKIIGTGSRAITFVNRGYSAAIFLPPLLADDNTEHLFRCLQIYEIVQPLDRKKREFSSYLRFMSELIPTPEDAHLLRSKGIIHGNHKYRGKLPIILKKLASEDKYNQNFCALTLNINNFIPPKWKTLLILAWIITIVLVLRTVYTVISYYKVKD